MTQINCLADFLIEPQVQSFYVNRNATLTENFLLLIIKLLDNIKQNEG